MSLEAGSRLGPYEIVGLLGSGGMGEVYRARDPRLGREVAVKVLPGELADARHLHRFEQEARAAGSLSHPNILAVHDVGTQDGIPYVVSELLEGQTLRVRLESGALPVRKALDYALQIARGLAAAHDKGIVHRDLKPENVFVTEDGRVKILDFGLAKLTRPPPLGSEEDDRSVTRPTESGVVLGTVGYMSPEQVRGEDLDGRSDIFSLGTVLHEMLSGSRAFRKPSAAETMNAILKEDPPELTEKSSGIPSGLVKIARRCLEKRAGERFHSAHDLALALETISSEASRSVSERGGGSLRVVDVTKRRRRALLAAMALVVVLAAGGLYWGHPRSSVPPAGDSIASVAVLPFENVGGAPDSEYLSDGVAESLINELARLPNLRVIARSTSFRFRGEDVDPRGVGRELGVGAVVSGRVSLRGDTVVIGAELVDVAQGTQLWGEHYNARMGDIFAVQEDIAGDISRGLRVKLAPADANVLARRRTVDPEAYRLYLLSRHEFNKATLEGYRIAVDRAQQAIERDPTYAPAYVALAQAIANYGAMGGVPYKEGNARSKAAAVKALELDDRLTGAHTALASALMYLDWDWAGAERELARSLELDPRSSEAHAKFGYYLVLIGRSEEGLEHEKQALELDPLSARLRVGLFFAYYLGRQYDQALEQVSDLLRFDDHPQAPALRLLAYREKGMYEEAIAEGRVAMANQGCEGHLGNAYARAGMVKEARDCLHGIRQRVEEGSLGAYSMAVVYAGLGEKDQAFDWLERAREERDQGVVFLKVDPTLDPLRSDPRFDDLLRRMNFPS